MELGGQKLQTVNYSLFLITPSFVRNNKIMTVKTCIFSRGGGEEKRRPAQSFRSNNYIICHEEVFFYNDIFKISALKTASKTRYITKPVD